MLSGLSLPQIQLHQSVTHKSAVRQGEKITYNEAIHDIVIGIIFIPNVKHCERFFCRSAILLLKKSFFFTKSKKQQKKRPQTFFFIDIQDE